MTHTRYCGTGDHFESAGMEWNETFNSCEACVDRLIRPALQRQAQATAEAAARFLEAA